jgi:hypothetical protein
VVRDEEWSERRSPWSRYMRGMVSFVRHTGENWLIVFAVGKRLLIVSSESSRPDCHVITIPDDSSPSVGRYNIGSKHCFMWLTCKRN